MSDCNECRMEIPAGALVSPYCGAKTTLGEMRDTFAKLSDGAFDKALEEIGRKNRWEFTYVATGVFGLLCALPVLVLINQSYLGPLALYDFSKLTAGQLLQHFLIGFAGPFLFWACIRIIGAIH